MPWESPVLKWTVNGHRDEILHVAFSRDSSVFVTSSKDAFFKIWRCKPLVQQIAEKNMRKAKRWDCVIYSQFNNEGTRLLVCGGLDFNMHGETAVYCVKDYSNLQLLCCVTNHPRPCCAVWYDNEHFLSSYLVPPDELDVTDIWITTVPMNIQETICVSRPLHTFKNTNYSDIQKFLVAHYIPFKGNNRQLTYIIYAVGTGVTAPHALGIQQVTQMNTGGKRTEAGVQENDQEETVHKFDMKGHIVGFCLSPDHKTVYVRYRPWCRPVDNFNYHMPEPLVENVIKIEAFDLDTFSWIEVCVYSIPRNMSPADQCFFIDLDVSEDWMASGSEDNRGYLWHRQNGKLICRFDHKSLVSKTAFNPKDPGMVITVSDDNTFKVWVSHRLE